MRLEVGRGHFAAGDEGDEAREDSRGDHQTANELDDARKTKLRHQRHLLAAEHAKELLGAVTGEEQAGDDAEQTVASRERSGQE